jgi:hypothetical protein
VDLEVGVLLQWLHEVLFLLLILLVRDVEDCCINVDYVLLGFQLYGAWLLHLQTRVSLIGYH